MKTLADNPATVLIVNDDQMQLDLLRDLLEPEGYQIFWPRMVNVRSI
jgi:CheY-like chemotaxis protein